MGNVGSTQHLNLEDVNNEIQSYYKQQQLRHSSKLQQSPNSRRSNFNSNSKAMHWTRLLPHMINNGGVDVGTVDRDIAVSVPTTMLPNCKVLPHVNERFKLRPTTNGVILSSGGTISGKREQLHKKNTISQLPQPRGLKQRSQTFIYDDSKNVSWKYTQATHLNFEQSFDLQNCPQSFPACRRSQTNLGINIKSDKNQAGKSLCRKMVFASTNTKVAEEELKNIKSDQRQVEDKDQVPSTQNKCNKKRKAPPAPSLWPMPVPKSATSATSSPSNVNKYFTEAITNNSYTRVIKPTAVSKSLLDNKTLLRDLPTRCRLFHSNLKISPSKLAGKNLHESQQQTQNQLMDAETDFTSLSIAATKDATKEICNHLRREKSSSAILERQKSTRHDINNEPLITENVYSKSSSLSQVKSKDSKHKNGQQKYSSSKIPQLNRTLYFGMSTRSMQALATAEVVETTRQKAYYLINGKNLAMYENSENIDTSTTAVIKATTGNSVSDYKTHAPSDVKPIIDNGLLIQVRPTLPRRQLNTPNFSPVVAWHMLVYQQHHHKLQEFKHTCGEKIRKQNKCKDKTNKNEISAKSSLLPYLTRNENGVQCVRGAAKISTEAPIKLTSNLHKMAFINTWTPQQDEVDPSEKQFSESAVPNHIAQQENPFSCAQVNRNITEVGKLGSPEVSRLEAVGKAISSTNMHVFSLTLPRDVHTKAQHKILQSINTSFTLKNEPTRSADSTAGSPYKPISKCCCLPAGMKIQQRLPLALDDILPHENNCPLHSDNGIVIRASEPLSNLTDNWVLHKVKYDEGEALNTCQISSDGRCRKWSSTASVEPISLSYLIAGKHVMYLPGEEPNANTTRNGVSCRITMRKGEQNQYKQQQRRQEIVCQSLRDELTNLGNYTLTASHVPVKAASGTERPQQFTFQSTIRLLEKKRLAERLAKDAKLREAQRKSELEAMKCVEDDFQRKRVIEKASSRYQVQLHLSAEKVKENGIATVDGNLSPEVPHGLQYDHNNNIACRTDPDGALSNTPPRCRTREGTLSYSDCGDKSDTEVAELSNFQHPETLLEPYLQSIIN